METNKPATLCWHCKNACGKCSWSDGTFTPVDGWEATPTKLNIDGERTIKSYCVNECPQFDPDDVMIPLSKLSGRWSMTTLYLHIKRGDLKAEMIDHRWFVREWDFKQFEKNYARYAR